MRLIAICACLLWMPVVASAQSAEQEAEDKGYLTSLIEDNLSGDTRSVSIIGFQGALSSEASISTLTVADSDGIWLTLEGVVLNWNRSALLRGAIDIDQISANRVIVARAPLTENAAPSPEASPFALPELPVSIALDTLAVNELILGESFLGEEIALSLAGTAQLSGGEGSADVTATRLGPKAGIFAIKGAYSNTSRVLDLLLDLQEDPNGIVATTIGLPGSPSLALQVAGEAPLDDYQAQIKLATDGQDRVTGAFEIARDASGAIYELNLDGDVTPLFAPEYQEFFGPQSTLEAAFRTTADGDMSVEAFDLKAEALTLSGNALIGTQGWPQRLSLTGRIADPSGDVVLLPLGGDKTFVDSVTLNLGYDAAVSEDWSASFDITGFDRPGLYLRQVALGGGGTLISGEGAETGSVTADFTYTADGLELTDAGLADAFGDKITGVIAAQRSEGAPTEITRLTLNGPGIEVLADAIIDGPAERFRTRSNVLLTVQALKRFSTLAGRDLAGSGNLAIGSTIVPLDGLFDLIVSGTTQDLSIGIPQLDATFQGAGRISAAAARDTDGTRLTAFSIRTDKAALTATADLTSEGSQGQAQLTVTEARLIEPKLSGPATLIATFEQTEEGVTDARVELEGADLTARAEVQVNPAETGQTTNFDAQIDADDLRRLAALAERELSGAADLRVKGVLLADTMRFDADIDGTTQDLAIGVTALDPLLAGQGRVTGAISRLREDLFRVSDFIIQTSNAKVSLDGQGGLRGEAEVIASARLSDMAALNAGVSGPAAAQVTVQRDSDEIAQVTIDATGPGAKVDIDATVAPPDKSYAVTGNIDAQIADLAPYRALVGQPVSGGLTVSASGMVLPDLTEFDASMSAVTRNLGVGNVTVDRLLAGAGRVDATASLAQGSLRVPNFTAETPQVRINANLDGRDGAGNGRFDARLADIGLLTDQLSGPVTANGTASLSGNGTWGVNANADGPGGIALTAQGQYGNGGRVDMDVTGTAPLGLANPLLKPRRLSGNALFDLSINGQPSLEAVGGRITLADARLAAPTIGKALSGITGGVTLASGQATVGLQAQVEGGGSLSVNGPVQLDGANSADLTIRANDVVLRDPQLYETTVSGILTANGPLQGGARIAGQLNLGPTEVQVPSSGIGALGDLPDVVHIGASSGVKQTIIRADAGPKPSAANAGSGPIYPLDITINAPSRIFIRGRGLDAELGGSLRIGGTTKNVIPSGLFELARGRIDILQQRFDLTEGSASLQGDFVPVIRLVATTRTTTGTTVRIIVEGPATEPEVRFESTPELPQDEVLSQLIFGRDIASISPLQAVQLAAAVGTLAGRGGGGLVDTFRKDIGLDDFDITSDEDGNAAVRAGKYLTENVYTDVTVSSDGSTDININLDITDEFTAKGSVGADGETSIGVFFERDY